MSADGVSVTGVAIGLGSERCLPSYHIPISARNPAPRLSRWMGTSAGGLRPTIRVPEVTEGDEEREFIIDVEHLTLPDGGRSR